VLQHIQWLGDGQSPDGDERLTESQAKYYAAVAALSLRYLGEQGVLFRDLKLTNMMLDDRGRAKIIDFGKAKRLNLDSRTYTICGTRHYFPPEALGGAASASSPSPSWEPASGGAEGSLRNNS